MRKYIHMTDSNFNHLQEFGTRFFVADFALPKEKPMDVIKQHSNLPHSTKHYLITDLNGYRQEIRA